MDIFEEAEMELGLEPGELRGTFPEEIEEAIARVTSECQHKDVIPHRTWDTGRWYWTCSDCYSYVNNETITDRMRQNG